MATRKTTVEYIDPEDNENTAPPEEDDRGLQDILAELSNDDDIEMSVWEPPSKGRGPYAYLFQCGLADYTLSELRDYMRDEYGGGVYRIHIRKNGELVANKKLAIGGPKKIKPPVTTETPKQTSAVPDYIEQILENQNKQFERILNTIHASQSPAIDPIALQTSMMDSLIRMKEFIAPPEKTRAPDNPLETMKTFLEISNMLNSIKGGESDPLAEAIKVFGPTIAQAAQTGLKPTEPHIALGAGYPKGMTPPSAGVQPAPPKQNNPQPKEGHPMKLQLMLLCAGAETDDDPAAYAPIVIQKTPPEGLDKLLEFIKSGTAIEELSKIYAPIANYRAWFEELGECILELVQEEILSENLTKENNELNQSNTSDSDNGHGAIETIQANPDSNGPDGDQANARIDGESGEDGEGQPGNI